MGRKKIENFEKILPPYLSYKYFKEAIEYFKQLKFSTNDRIIWEAFKYKSIIVQRLCLAFKFFNFINTMDDVTPNFINFLYGTDEQKKQIILNAYKKFFEENPDWQTASRDEIKKKLEQTYNINKNTAEGSVAFFISLLKTYKILNKNKQTKEYKQLSKNISKKTILFLTPEQKKQIDKYQNKNIKYKIKNDKIYIFYK